MSGDCPDDVRTTTGSRRTPGASRSQVNTSNPETRGSFKSSKIKIGKG